MPKKHATKKTAKKAGAGKKNMVVIMSGDRPIHEVAGDLKNAGFEIDQMLPAIGQVTGRAATSAKKKLKGIHGVADVTDTHEDFNIGPPDAPVS
jgi:hypothetical protein